MSKYVIQCWSCGTRLNLDERNENDGDCIECGVELALDDYLDQAVTENDQLRAELAALKAGQGEAVAVHQYRTSTFISWIDCQESDFASAVAQGFEIRTLYTAPPASADAVSVPRELLEYLLERHDAHAMIRATMSRIEELRAILAQSQEMKP